MIQTHCFQCTTPGACDLNAGCLNASEHAARERKPTVRDKNPLTDSRARLFRLVRDDDETGISGTGVVAEGVEFSNGFCAMSWLTSMHSVAVYPNIRQLEAIHGHNGRARVVYVPREGAKT